MSENENAVNTLPESTPLESSEAVSSESSDNTSSSEAITPDDKDANIDLSIIIESLSRIEKLQQANSKELSAMNSKYHNGFDDVIKRQQAELDMFREGLGRNAVAGILKSIADYYSQYIEVSKSDDPVKVKKCFLSLLDDLLQLLQENGVKEHKSEVGDVYETKYCKISEKVPTIDLDLKDKVIESKSIGLYLDKSVLIPELVKIYVYDKNLIESKSEE
jgi:molecular chaperone GrpE (heat shock protein)